VRIINSDQDQIDSASKSKDEKQDNGNKDGVIFGENVVHVPLSQGNTINSDCIPICSSIELFSGMKWSNWSTCSTSCGIGFETRHLRCIDLVETDQPCPLNETEHVEKRPCKMRSCAEKTTNLKSPEVPHKYRMYDFIDNLIDFNQDKFRILRKHRIHDGMYFM